MRNPKYVVDFKATKRVVVPAKNEQEAIEKAMRRVGRFWQPDVSYPVKESMLNG